MLIIKLVLIDDDGKMFVLKDFVNTLVEAGGGIYRQLHFQITIVVPYTFL